jgi:hypothetical protein
MTIMTTDTIPYISLEAAAVDVEGIIITTIIIITDRARTP